MSYFPNTTIPNNLYGVANGTTPSSPFVDEFLPRAPTPYDIAYPIQKKWLNTVLGDYWLLEGFSSAGGVVTAIWIKIGSVNDVESLTGNTGGPVFPTTNNIDLVGDGTFITVVGNPATSTLTIEPAGGLATEYVENTGSAVPSAGILNILGGTGITTSGSGNTVTITSTAPPGVLTIDGDVGTATPAGGIINFHSTALSGSSVSFQASGNTVDLFLSDAKSNLILGFASGNNSISGTGNSLAGQGSGDALTTGSGNAAIGAGCFNDCTTGSYNTALGTDCFRTLLTGYFNIAAGYTAGNAYVGAESSNIVIGNLGVAAESNVIRIGNQGSGAAQQDLCYIAGITGSTPISGNIPQVVLCDDTGNLATISSSTSGYVLTSNGSATPTFQAAPGSTGIQSIAGDSGTPTTGPNVTVTGSSTGLTFAISGTTVDLGGTLDVANGGTGATTLTGVLIGHGTGAVTGNAVTQYDVLVGGASNAISSVGPGTAGQVLQSAGAAANPAYSTATYPLTTTANQILYSSSANTVAGLSTVNNGVLITSAAGVPSILPDGTTGQVLTATTGSPPSWSNPATSGTVTSVSVVSANGLAGTVATATTTPAITISTTATGVLSGNGTAISGSAITQYDVLVGGASNAITSVSPSTATYVLTSNGVSTNPTFQALPASAVTSVTGTANQILASPTTGAVVLSLIGPYTPATYTAHGVLLGEGTSSIVAVAPNATSGLPLISQGSTTDPAYGTAVVAGGGTGDTSFTAYSVICGGTTSTAALQNVSGVGTAAQVLTSNGAGALPTWQAASGGNGFNYLSSNKSVYGGTNSTLSFTGADNVVVGVTAGNALTSGTDNTLYGYEAGEALTSGNFNTFLGSLAGITSATDSDNTFIGYKAGTVVSGGSDSTLVGYEAGLVLTSGAQNTLVGSGAGVKLTTGADNLCIGYKAGSSLVSATNTICVGANAGLACTGSDCVIIGADQSTITSGTGNIGIGYFCSLTAATTGQICIGYSCSTGGTTAVAIGYQGSAASSGIGIGYQCLAGTNGIAIGASSNNNAVTGGVSLGYAATCVAGGIAIGYNSKSASANSVVISTASSQVTTDSASNQVCFGNPTNSLKDFYLGNGAVATASPANITMQPTPASGSNAAGATYTVRGGVSTGSGAGGAVIFQTTPAGASSSTPNTETTVGQVTSTGAWTLGATSTTPTHVLNTNSTTGASIGTLNNTPGTTAGGNPTGFVQITINGTTAYIPYWT